MSRRIADKRAPWQQRVVHRNLTVLAVREPGVFDEMRERIALDDFVLAVLSDMRLLIDPARTGELQALLNEAGLAPLVQRARGNLSD